ncbi:hypothetical protein NKH56_33445 [Mesorhizobium sp. M1076]
MQTRSIQEGEFEIPVEGALEIDFHMRSFNPCSFTSGNLATPFAPLTQKG